MSVKLCLFKYGEVEDLVANIDYSSVNWNFNDDRWNAKDISSAKKVKLVSI